MTEENILKEDFNTSKELEEKKLEQFIETTTKSYKNNLEKYAFHKNLLRMLNIDRTARLNNHDIMIDNFKPINPHWQFETIPEYQNNLAIIQAGIKIQDEENYKISEKQVQQVLDVTMEQLKSEWDTLQKYDLDLEKYAE